MLLKGWIKHLRSKVDRHRRKRVQDAQRAFRQQLDFQPTLARLEDRRVLSADFSLVGSQIELATSDGGSGTLQLSADVSTSSDATYSTAAASTETPLMSAGNVAYQGTDGNDAIEVLQVTESGVDYIEVWLDGTRQAKWVSTEVSEITIDGGDGDDTLTVNYAASAGFFEKNVTFNGGGPTTGLGDTLVINGGNFTSITNTLTNRTDGSIDLDGTRVRYTGLEPVLINVGSVTDIVFNLPASDNIVFLEDDGTSGNTLSQLRSGNGTFETTTFFNPTSSLTIYGDAGAFNDTITIRSLPDLNASLKLSSNSGAGTDTVTFAGTDTFDSLIVNVTGTISDDGTADVTVTNNASFHGDAITLDDTYAFGSLTFNSPGAVEITETDATILRGTSTADRLSLTSDGTISDDGTADIIVTNNASFRGDAITLDDTYAFGSLTFNSPGAVEIIETDATILRGISTADRLSLTSGGTISDDGTADVTVTNNASFRGDAITLDDTYAFGSLTFNSPGAVEITETDATILRGTSTADRLSLTSGGTISDDGTADVTVTNNASFHGDAITLADTYAFGSPILIRRRGRDHRDGRDHSSRHQHRRPFVPEQRWHHQRRRHGGRDRHQQRQLPRGRDHPGRHVRLRQPDF